MAEDRNRAARWAPIGSPTRRRSPSSRWPSSASTWPQTTVRAGRIRTLRAVQSTYVALPVAEEVASAFAALVAAARLAGHRAKVQDAWIAAAARAHDVPVYVPHDDFETLAVDVVRVLAVGAAIGHTILSDRPHGAARLGRA